MSKTLIHLSLSALLATACGTADDSTVADLEQRIAQLEQDLETATDSTTSTASSVPTPPTTAEVAATSPPDTALELEPPDAEVVWFSTGSETDDFFRFLAFVHNPNDVPIQGVVTHWEALDADGVIVGSVVRTFPVIGPGVSFPYAGGAGSAILTGQPAGVALFVDEMGRAAEGAPSPLFEIVEDAELTFNQGTDSWEAEAVFQSPDRSVQGSDVDAVWILHGQGGSVVGAEFGFGFNVLLPDAISPGAQLRVENSFTEPDATPIAVELFVFED